MPAAKAWSEGGPIDAKRNPLEELELGAMDDVIDLRPLRARREKLRGRFLGTG